MSADEAEHTQRSSCFCSSISTFAWRHGYVYDGCAVSKHIAREYTGAHLQTQTFTGAYMTPRKYVHVGQSEQHNSSLQIEVQPAAVGGPRSHYTIGLSLNIFIVLKVFCFSVTLWCCIYFMTYFSPISQQWLELVKIPQPTPLKRDKARAVYRTSTTVMK